MSKIYDMGLRAKEASILLGKMKTDEKNKILTCAAEALISNKNKILDANKKDVDVAGANEIKGTLIDRLTLNEGRIRAMADGLIQVASLNDPVGEFITMNTLPNGLVIGKKRVPMGVIGIIFESRPNVTADAYGLCLKGGQCSYFKRWKRSYKF